MRILKIFFVVIFLFLICVLLYLNLGKFLDVTKQPAETDLIVCLGGGNYKLRVQKTLEMYKRELDTSNVIILTGFVNSQRDVKQGVIEDKRLTFLKEYIPKATVVINKTLQNTAEEVIFVKRYMLKYHLDKVTFITEPPHSRRIIMIFSMLSLADDAHLNVTVVGSDYKNWSRDRYYENKFTKNYAFIEVLKIIYAVLKYKICKPMGLLPWFEKKFSEDINTTKKYLNINYTLYSPNSKICSFDTILC